MEAIAKAILSNKSKVVGITAPDFKLHYRVIATKNSLILAQNMHMDQYNRVEDTEVSP
jgi:hypothetical protein